MATQIFLQGRWINGTTFFEMEDFQFVYLNYVSSDKSVRFFLIQSLNLFSLAPLGQRFTSQIGRPVALF
jgi:hypothetical protein